MEFFLKIVILGRVAIYLKNNCIIIAIILK